MTNFALIFIVGFLKVAARAFQQKNVMHDEWLLIIPTSYVMAVLDLTVYGVIAIDIGDSGMLRIIPLSIAYGTGSWLGSWVAIWLHKRLHKK